MSSNLPAGGNKRIDGERLWKALMEMAQIGATLKGGVNRISFTPEDKASRDLFTRWCEAESCTVKIDVLSITI